MVVGKGSAYDLYLARELKNASIFQALTSPTVVHSLVSEGMEEAAGVKQQLQADAAGLSGFVQRALDEHRIEGASATSARCLSRARIDAARLRLIRGCQ